MKKHLLYIIIATACLFGCQPDNQYERVKYLLNKDEEVSANNLNEASAIILNDNDLSEEEADTLMEMFESYLEALAINATKELNNTFDTVSDFQVFIDSLTSQAASYKKYGIELFMSEGIVDYDISPIFTTQTFAYYLSDFEKEMAGLYQTEIENPSLNDAALIVSYQEICNRLLKCDIIKSNCDNEMKMEEIDNYRNMYLSILVSGVDNSPAYDWETGILQNEIKDAINNYIAEFPTMESSAFLKKFIDIMEQSGYKETEESKKLIDNYLYNKTED